MDNRTDPASAAGNLAGGAIQTAVLSSIVIPVLQLVLLTLLNAMPEAGAGQFNEFLDTYRLVITLLPLLPIASTIVSAVVAYALGGKLGVIGYFVVSFSASAMIGANLLAAVVFLVGFVWLVGVFAVNLRSKKQHRRPPL